jgi:hypothetical protein
MERRRCWHFFTPIVRWWPWTERQCKKQAIVGEFYCVYHLRKYKAEGE